jgi:hypothetical protein
MLSDITRAQAEERMFAKLEFRLSVVFLLR